MALPITLAEARTHIETDLADAALQRLIDDADALVVQKFGSHSGAITVLAYGGHDVLILARPALSFTSITEYASGSDTTGTVLATSDYRLENGGRVLRRLTTGANPSGSWGDRASIVYTPTADTAQRTRVEIDLVRLAAQYEAKRSESIGDYSATHVEYESERQRILGSLGARLTVA